MRRSERGEGKAANIIWFVVIAAGIYSGWNVVPVYVDNYTFKDTMINICRQPRGTHTDEKILDMLVKEAQEQGLYLYIGRQNFRVTTMDTYRRISLQYEREAQVLPGLKKTFRFKEDVEQPLLF